MESLTTEQNSQRELQRSASLLLIDDEPLVREAAALSLERRGYTVLQSDDGRQALKLLCGGALPDLILLDVAMPGMDGWQFRVEQKRNPAWAAIPVVAFSADSKALAMDAADYVQKPVDESTLCATIERVLADSVRDQESDVTRRLQLLERPLGYTLANLQLACSRADELERRLEGRDAFSMVGIRQLMTRAQRGAVRVAQLTQSLIVDEARHAARAESKQAHLVRDDAGNCGQA